MATLVPVASLTNYVELAKNLGLNPHRLLASCGLSQKMLDTAEQRVPAVSVLQLLETSARDGNCPTLGLQLAESRKIADFGVISLLLSHQATLRAALRIIVDYRHLLNDALAIYIEEVDKTVVIREEIVTDQYADSRQGIELALGVMYRFCSALLGQHWQPHAVCFSHEAPADLSVYKRVFRCSLQFNAEFNGIVCSSTMLDSANPLADPSMAAHAKRFIDSLYAQQPPSLGLEVKKAIYLLLPMGRATIEQVAPAVGMNVRTLQRALEKDQDSFSDLLNLVRVELVQRYMQNPAYSLSRIADLLGYSIPSSFTRWFHNQFGVSPTVWRQRQQKNEG